MFLLLLLSVQAATVDTPARQVTSTASAPSTPSNRSPRSADPAAQRAGMARLPSRISNRIQTRIYSRIGETDQPRLGSTDAYTIARNQRGHVGTQPRN